MKKTISLFLIMCISLLLPQGVFIRDGAAESTNVSDCRSIRNPVEDVVIIPDGDPFFGIISTSIACWYDQTTNTTGLIPLLVQNQGHLNDQGKRFLDTYMSGKNKTILALGYYHDTTYETHILSGSAVDVSMLLAATVFVETSTVMIIPYDALDAYQLSLASAPLASYLNIPILIYDNNEVCLQLICSALHVTQMITIGDLSLSFENISTIHLATEEEIQQMTATIIKQQFGIINYITMTNPADTYSPIVTNFSETNYTVHFTNRQLTFLGKTVNLQGTDTHQYTIPVSTGFNHIQVSAYFHMTNKPLFDPIIYLNFYDPLGNVVSYANSFGYASGKTYLETFTCNAPGNYTLEIMVYHGIKGGFFSLRGFSLVDNDVEFSINISQLEKPHYSLVPNLSLLAAYLTAAHGGIMLADPECELIDEQYAQVAAGSGTGPWYNESLHSYNNEKVNYTVEQLNDLLMVLDDADLLNGFLCGPAWLGILADTNMIPMYYYQPSQQNIAERGLPSDNLYSLGENLSVGRILSWDVQDVSVLICRTLFYEEICGQPNSSDPWFTRFSFICGEGFSETGGIFHQIPYSRQIKHYGFNPRFYGDFLNSRQITTLFKAYTGANYIEYLGHGDWFWFPPALYGFDTFSRAVDVAHVHNWVYEKPSVFLTSACLMGRVDGISARMNIGLAMLHAGCNAFVGATRETGQESGLTTLEDHLIVDNWSIGEALRGEKQVDHELPTYYVRTLYGDPSFNPYEPNNGFSTQGRPQFIDE